MREFSPQTVLRYSKILIVDFSVAITCPDAVAGNKRITAIFNGNWLSIHSFTDDCESVKREGWSITAGGMTDCFVGGLSE
jgi:hypothetical protein